MATDFFPQRPNAHPMIYAYEDTNPQYRGLLKVGYTAIDVDKRVAQQYPTKRPDGSVPYRIVYRESAMYPDGSSFTDHDVHRVLKRKQITGMGGEWFRCTVDDVRAAVLAVRNHTDNVENRVNSFSMRPEQQEAVDKTAVYFQSAYEEDSTRSPKFLWNCKMRFGKTFASYQLAKRMGFKRILILTFKPAVVSAWQEDLNSHIDFEGWQFISRNTELTYETADKSRPIVCFGSFQDYLGVNPETGGIKAKNEWVHSANWDLVIFDEYHFGAWKENAQKLFEQEDEDSYDSEDMDEYDRGNAYDETFLPITTMYYLYLSGTPFRALNSGEFIEDQIYNWTYSDEQRAKENWQGDGNPYAALPRMVMMTYRIPDSIRQIAMQGEFNEFDLNVFFSAKGKGADARFVYENEVQKWLDLIRGAYLETSVDDLKLGAKKPAMPYADVRLLNVLQHTLWFLPNVASCYAMKNLLMQKQNTFYHDYTVNVCAGARAGVGAAALEPVQRSMRDPLESKTITLSCGKLTTGVTVKPWTGIFMLRNLSSPETYFQAAFRVQSPWEITTDGGKKEIIKKECYVFDFALDRALKQISDYSCRLNIDEGNPEKKVEEFINFLPVIAYDGSAMRQINAGEILDIAMAGTSATLLAKRWESALLVNVDNDTLSRLMANQAAMDALMKIEGFRSLNEDIQTIINKSEAVKKAKKEGKEKLTQNEKRELSEEEKEYKSKRKQIQEKLIKFATRIPVFMYLTDYRERCLKDVITQLEPELFKKVTGMDIGEFELLVSLGVFNDALMNDAIYKFKRYEDASLNYTGINRHEGEDRGGWDTVITDADNNRLFALQPASADVLPKKTFQDSTKAVRSTDQPKNEKTNSQNVDKTQDKPKRLLRKRKRSSSLTTTQAKIDVRAQIQPKNEKANSQNVDKTQDEPKRLLRKRKRSSSSSTTQAKVDFVSLLQQLNEMTNSQNVDKTQDKPKRLLRKRSSSSTTTQAKIDVRAQIQPKNEKANSQNVDKIQDEPKRVLRKRSSSSTTTQAKIDVRAQIQPKIEKTNSQNVDKTQDEPKRVLRKRSSSSATTQAQPKREKPLDLSRIDVRAQIQPKIEKANSLNASKTQDEPKRVLRKRSSSSTTTQAQPKREKPLDLSRIDVRAQIQPKIEKANSLNASKTQDKPKRVLRKRSSSSTTTLAKIDVRAQIQPKNEKANSQNVDKTQDEPKRLLKKRKRSSSSSTTQAEPKREKPLDLSRIDVGSKLHHKTFGVGKVKEIRGNVIVVLFGRVERKFNYPDALSKGFLTLPN